jgi:hypothetical protein
MTSHHHNSEAMEVEEIIISDLEEGEIMSWEEIDDDQMIPIRADEMASSGAPLPVPIPPDDSRREKDPLFFHPSHLKKWINTKK